MIKKCQCCGNHICSLNNRGTESNGEYNGDYCSNCYKSGYFFVKDLPVVYNDVSPFKGLFTEYKMCAFFGEYAGYRNYAASLIHRIRTLRENARVKDDVISRYTAHR